MQPYKKKKTQSKKIKRKHFGKYLTLNVKYFMQVFLIN